MHKLTARGVATLRFDGKPKKHFDGGGLYLYITKSARTWRYAYRFGGVEKTYTIGSADSMSLADARRKHQEARSLIESGVDPVVDRARSRSERAAIAEERKTAPKVGELLEDYLERKKREIASADRTESNLRQLRPEFLDIRVAELKAADIIAELLAIAERRSVSAEESTSSASRARS